MKKLLSLFFFCTLSIAAFSQDANVIEKYKNLGNEPKFYELVDACANTNKTEGCWKLGLNWDSSESDYSIVGSSKMHFYYVPTAISKCDKLAFYELSPNPKTGIWSFKDKNISISVKMRSDESAFGKQLSEVRLTNLAGESCFGPKTFFKKF
jgi:hypothetical protein